MGGLLLKPQSASGPKIGKPGSVEQATFAAGCFWGVEKLFKERFGSAFLSTKVGYTGGHLHNPEFHRVLTGSTGHAQALHIVFNPNMVTYKDLVIYFFRIHDPTTLNRQGKDVGTQFRSAIFYYSEHQKTIAEDVKRHIKGNFKQPIITEIVPAKPFYDAEEVHQNYFEKNPNSEVPCTHKLHW